MHALVLFTLLGCNRPAAGYLVQGTDITVSPEALDFASVPFGSTTALPVTIANAGTDAAPLEFTVDGPFTLAATSYTLAPDATYGLDVRYAATSYAAASGSVTVTWTGSDGVTLPITASTDGDSDGDGQAAIDAGGSDCDDDDATVYPGAPDACYDHIDQDCDAGGGDDPEEVDCDGDGVQVGADCDDEAATTYPGAPEVSGDLVDQDCDGLRDEDDRAPGDVVITEIKPGSGGWVELCNTTSGAVPVDGFVVAAAGGSTTLPSYTLDVGMCVAVCERVTADCALQGTFNVADSGDQVGVTAGGLELDLVAIETNWGWAAWDVASLDGGSLTATANDDRNSWCDTHGSPGATNPACP